MKSKICEYCGKEYIPKNRGEQGRNSKYCSNKCSNTVHPPPKHGESFTCICSYCGITYTPIRKGKLGREQKFCSITCRNKLMSGKNHWNWKGGVTEELRLIRQSKEYSVWRKSVYERDYWTCQICGIKQNHPIAHHIKSFTNFPELRFDIDNGITLCRKCHVNEHRDLLIESRIESKLINWRK